MSVRKQFPLFPKDIQLKENSLVEAWLELRWKTEPANGQLDASPPDTEMVDPQFAIALGNFFHVVKKTGYSTAERLPAANIPEHFAPHFVRYRFAKARGAWPILQIGPGIATVNFTKPYTWPLFRTEAELLRSSLVKAYEPEDILPNAMVLRYRNAFKYLDTPHSLLPFLADSLNFEISLSERIPGRLARSSGPQEFAVNLGYDLLYDGLRGNIKIAKGKNRNDEGQEVDVVVVDLEVHATKVRSSLISSERHFMQWLEEAHDVTHEWYFALIDGALRQKYEEGR